tara:strand:- start:676 stop:1302 length:627 start_codon:yes stop_codon:yes gene_type:complete
MAVLITIPHGATPTGDGTHNSDSGALEFISNLEAALEELDVPFVVMVGKANRDIIDLNRLRAHSHPWVKEVREEMLEADLHIDLHSFPPVDVPTKTSTGYSLDVWSRFDVVLFNTPEITEQDFLRSLENELEQMSIGTAEEQGGFENYLSNMANVLFDLPSVLLEINEGRSQNYPQVASALAVGILNHLELLSEQLPLDDEPLPVELA